MYYYLVNFWWTSYRLTIEEVFVSKILIFERGLNRLPSLTISRMPVSEIKMVRRQPYFLNRKCWNRRQRKSLWSAFKPIWICTYQQRTKSVGFGTAFRNSTKIERLSSVLRTYTIGSLDHVDHVDDLDDVADLDDRNDVMNQQGMHVTPLKFNSIFRIWRHCGKAERLRRMLIVTYP